MEALLRDRYASSTLMSLISTKELVALSEVSHSTRESLCYIDWHNVYVKLILHDPLECSKVHRVWNRDTSKELWRRLCVRYTINEDTIDRKFNHPLEMIVYLSGCSFRRTEVWYALLRVLELSRTNTSIIEFLLEEGKFSRSDIARAMDLYCVTASKEVLRFLYRKIVAMGKNDRALVQQGRTHIESTFRVLIQRFTQEEVIWITGSRSVLRRFTQEEVITESRSVRR